MSDVKLICKQEQKISKLTAALEMEKKQLEDIKQGTLVPVNRFVIVTHLNELELYNKLINVNIGKFTLKKGTRTI